MTGACAGDESKVTAGGSANMASKDGCNRSFSFATIIAAMASLLRAMSQIWFAFSRIAFRNKRSTYSRLTSGSTRSTSSRAATMVVLLMLQGSTASTLSLLLCARCGGGIALLSLSVMTRSSHAMQQASSPSTTLSNTSDTLSTMRQLTATLTTRPCQPWHITSCVLHLIYSCKMK
jgi:hypothetical protein